MSEAPKIDYFAPQPLVDTRSLLNMLIWGPPGAGKTTLLATAPPRILLVNFDREGQSSIKLDPKLPHINPDNVEIIDLSYAPQSTLEKLSSPVNNPIEKVILNDPSISTIAVDSLTHLAEKGMELAADKTGVPLEKPGWEGANWRNVTVQKVLNRLHRIAGQHSKHFICTAHEGTPHKDERTGIMFSTIMLGGQLPILVPAKMSEVWHYADTSGKHVVTLRATATLKPMKSRMFDISEKTSFNWLGNMSLTEFFNQWSASGSKLQVPSPTTAAKK